MNRAWGVVGLLCLLLLSGCFQTVRYAGPDGNATQTNQAARYNFLATRMAQSPLETQQAQQAVLASTAQAASAELTSASAWPVVFTETFDNNDHNWPIEPDEGELVNMSFAIDGGVYRMSAETYESFIYWACPDGTEVGDFYLSLEARRISDFSGGNFGVTFGFASEENYFLFRVDDSGWYTLEHLQEGAWITLLPWTETTLLVLDDWNTIEMIAQGENLTFFINHEFAASAQVGFFLGSVGIVVGLYDPGAQASFEFDNFVLQAP